jgi:single-strand DNA-binding protein
MNSINLIGNLCGDLELRQTNGGKSVTQFNLAVKRPFSRDTTDFIPVVVYDQPAEYLSRYAHKGTKVAVTGKLISRNYEDKNGNKRTAFEVVADVAEICESRESNTDKPQSNTYVPNAYESAYASNSQNFETIPTDDNLPF